MKKTNIFLLLALVLFVAFPLNAYAYLDPGSGNALVYLVISLLGAIVYFVKNLAYKVIGKVKGEKPIAINISEEHDKIVLFSEGKSYWYTFKPIVDAFIEKQIPFSYLTMDIYDPALTIDNPYMASKYVGDGSGGFAKIANKRCKIMLSTTPNIGTVGFPLPRPKHVECLAHIFHAMGDIALYHKGSLDHYDTALMVGPYMEDSIRKVEKARNLPSKECISLGLPYLDVLAENIEQAPSASNTKTILIAPSWGDKSCLNLYSTKFVHDIAKAGYEVIIRPHPQSWKVEQDRMQSLKEEFASYTNIVFDKEADGSKSLAKADLLISDKSGVRFDFALIYEKPVITIDAPIQNLEQYEYPEIGEIWEDTVSHELGKVIIPDENLNILQLIQESLDLPTSHFKEFREKHVCNFKSSGLAIAVWTEEKLHELEKNISKS